MSFDAPCRMRRRRRGDLYLGPELSNCSQKNYSPLVLLSHIATWVLIVFSGTNFQESWSEHCFSTFVAIKTIYYDYVGRDVIRKYKLFTSRSMWIWYGFWGHHDYDLSNYGHFVMTLHNLVFSDHEEPAAPIFTDFACNPLV